MSHFDDFDFGTAAWHQMCFSPQLSSLRVNFSSRPGGSRHLLSFSVQIVSSFGIGWLWATVCHINRMRWFCSLPVCETETLLDECVILRWQGHLWCAQSHTGSKAFGGVSAFVPTILNKEWGLSCHPTTFYPMYVASKKQKEKKMYIKWHDKSKKQQKPSLDKGLFEDYMEFVVCGLCLTLSQSVVFFC